MFHEGEKTEEIELVVGPNYGNSITLTGQPLPGFEGIDIPFNAERATGKAILVCFWDMNQRPSRNMITELAERGKYCCLHYNNHLRHNFILARFLRNGDTLSRVSGVLFHIHQQVKEFPGSKQENPG